MKRRQFRDAPSPARPLIDENSWHETPPAGEFITFTHELESPVHGGANPMEARVRVPRRTLLVCALAFIVPLLATWLMPQPEPWFELMVWLPAILPAQLMAYFRGLRGSAATLAAGVTVFVVAQLTRPGVAVSQEYWFFLISLLCVYIVLSLAAGLMADALRSERRQAEQLGLTDPLTLLPNRRYADIMLNKEFTEAVITGKPLVVVLFDLDGFKAFNDRNGHGAGDDALRCFATTLAAATRRMDTSARYGGEEFITVLSPSSLAVALAFVERARAALRRAQGKSEDALTVSAGVAVFGRGMNTPIDLVHAADIALYQAKRDGRDCVRVYSGPVTEDPQAGDGVRPPHGHEGFSGPSGPARPTHRQMFAER
jgi:diguanylate cyclase (GGDEF)-like protein